MRLTIGFLVALLGTIASHTGFVLLKRGAESVPRITWRLSWAVARAFLRCRIWLAGTALQIASFIAYAVALSLAPVSVVQPVTSAGILVLVFLAVVYLKERISVAEGLCIALVIVGLPILAVSLGSSDEVEAAAPHLGILLFSLGALAATGLAMVAVARIRRGLDWGVGLGMLTGVLYGVSTLVLKGLTMVLKSAAFFSGVALVYMVLVIALNTFPYVLMQAAFQRGKASTVVPTMSALTAALPVLGGIWVFSERLPASTTQGIARVVGIVTILVGAIALSRFSQASLPATGPPCSPEQESAVVGQRALADVGESEAGQGGTL
ncbi:MAG: DMT family transporter [Actinomycetota bacterium]